MPAAATERGTDCFGPPEVGVADDCCASAWDAYVTDHREGTLFHTWAWRQSVREVFGHRPFYLMAKQSGSVVGVLPLFEMRSVLAGRLLVSVPYAVYGGALVSNGWAADGLRSAACELARQERVRQVEVRSRRAVWAEWPTVDRRYVTFEKPLPAKEDQVLAGLPRKARAAARNARCKHGLTVEFGDRHLGEVWALYARSMRRVGSPNYPIRFFHDLLMRTPGGHVVTLVRHGCRPAAGLVSFIHCGTLMPYFAGCDERLERFGPNNLLYLSAMEWGVRNGLERFDFGRTRCTNTGALAFKRHQGFEPVPLAYQVWTPPGRSRTDLSPDNARLRWAIHLWQRLPLWVTRPAGALAVRSVPG